MFVDGCRSSHDDLLFYVMYDHNEDRDTVEFMRRDSKTLPRYTGTLYIVYNLYTQCIHSDAPWYCLGCVPERSSTKKLKRLSWGH